MLESTDVGPERLAHDDRATPGEPDIPAQRSCHAFVANPLLSRSSPGFKRDVVECTVRAREQHPVRRARIPARAPLRQHLTRHPRDFLPLRIRVAGQTEIGHHKRVLLPFILAPTTYHVRNS